MKKTTILLVALLITSTAAHAGGKTGNDLLTDCRDLVNGGYMYCLGFVTATAYATDRACIANEVTSGQMAYVAIRYFEAHPQIRQKYAYNLLTIWAFPEAFPCK
jgi:hypothetical protein